MATSSTNISSTTLCFCTLNEPIFIAFLIVIFTSIQLQALTTDAYLGYLTTPRIQSKINPLVNEKTPISEEMKGFITHTLKQAGLIERDNESLAIAFLPQGQTNDVWRITTSTSDFILRKIRPHKFKVFNADRAEFLKQLTYDNPEHPLPRLYYYDAERGVSVLDYAQGQEIPFEQLTSQKLHQLGRLLKAFHVTPIDHYPSTTLFDPITVIEKKNSHYGITESQVDSQIVRIHQLLKAAYRALPARIALCHNDMLWSNILYDDQSDTLSLIDLDSVGLGHPYWDLGALLSWSDLDDNEATHLLTGYGIDKSSVEYQEVLLLKDICDLFEYYVNLKYTGLFNQLMVIKYANRLINKYSQSS